MNSSAGAPRNIRAVIDQYVRAGPFSKLNCGFSDGESVANRQIALAYLKQIDARS